MGATGGKHKASKKGKKDKGEVVMPPESIYESMLYLFWSEGSPYCGAIPDVVRSILSVVLLVVPTLDLPVHTSVYRSGCESELIYHDRIPLLDDGAYHWEMPEIRQYGVDHPKALEFLWAEVVIDDGAYTLEGGPYAVTSEEWTVSFPKPTGININMMPFDLHKVELLPEEYRGYWPLIQLCNTLQKKEPSRDEKIAYLTIDESEVDCGATQRRAGIHTDSPGMYIADKGGSIFYSGNGHPWGGGSFRCGLEITDGIFLASNISDSCRAWNVAVRPEYIGKGGNCEPLRAKLETLKEECLSMKANQLYWITDRTPHQSLPLKTKSYRQFFRLVTGPIAVWYSEHSTQNPTGIKPPSSVKILDINKFKQ